MKNKHIVLVAFLLGFVTLSFSQRRGNIKITNGLGVLVA
jgi:hypothetical protein